MARNIFFFYRIIFSEFTELSAPAPVSRCTIRRPVLCARTVSSWLVTVDTTYETLKEQIAGLSSLPSFGQVFSEADLYVANYM